MGLYRNHRNGRSRFLEIRAEWEFFPFSVSAAPILFQFGNLHEFVTCVGAQPTHASTPNVTPNNLENYYSLYLSPEQTASEPKIPRGYILW
jgi:hypothetical protein